MNTFYTLIQVEKAAMFWYGSKDIDSCCLAGLRLWREGWPKESIFGKCEHYKENTK